MEDRTRFWFGADSKTEALAMRVETITPDSVDKVGMSLVNYSDGYFEGDLIAPLWGYCYLETGTPESFIY